MSIIKEIKEWKIKYLYQRVIDYISQHSIEICRLTYISGSEGNLLKSLKNKLDEIIKEKKIKLEIVKDEDETSSEKLYQIMNDLVKSLKTIKENNNVLRQQLTIVQNLLFTKKDDKIFINFVDNDISNEIKDLILTYTSKVIEKLYYNIDSKAEDTEELQVLYLYLIFQIKDDNFVIKLKKLIYSLLYSNNKNRFNKFIIESSKIIVDKTKVDDEVINSLKKVILEKSEIDIKINNVSQNCIKFFKEKQRNNKNLYNFFTKDIIEKNFKLINQGDFKVNKDKDNYQEEKNIPKFEKKKIVVNELDNDSSKLHLFSPEFLITNGLKSKIDDSDIEIFNSDNYSIDIFSKFITEIIGEINKSIIEDNFSTNFIKIYSIQMHQNDILHYISAKLDNEHKKKLNEKKEEEENKISEKKNTFKIYIETNQNNNENESFAASDEKREYLSGSRLSSSKLSDKNKVSSDYFENLLNKLFIKNIQNEKLTTLPNILFMLNLKIPVYDRNNNSMHFESVHLDCFDKKKKSVNNNYFYGCKEIDGIFKNNSEEVRVSYEKYFSINLTYQKNKNENLFKLENKNEFFILNNSFFFCEIKKSFPNFGKGKEDVFNIEVYFPKIYKKRPSLFIPKTLESYCEQLIKLIKKFSFFSNTFNNKNDNNKKPNNHIVFIYDSINMSKEESNFQEIQKWTQTVLDEYMDRFKDMNVKFQLVFFDLLEFIDKEYQNMDKKDNTINELRKKNNELIEKDTANEIKINELIEKDNANEIKINELIEKNNELIEKDTANKIKINEIKKMKSLIEEQLKKDDNLDKGKILEMLKTFKFD